MNKRIQSLVRQHCAAFVGENGCRYCPNGQERCNFYRDDEQARPYIEAGTMQCGYFERHVLPIDPALEKAYWSTDELRGHNCKACGVPIVKRSNRQQFCGECAAERKRERERDRMRARRAGTA